MSPARPPGHGAAIAAMRALQRQARVDAGLGHPLFPQDQLAHALQRATLRENEAVPDGDLVRCGLWRHDRATEAARWARTRRILERASPGPDEDGRQLEMIARQAASVEMVLCGDHVGQPAPAQEALCEHLLLCTVPTMALSAGVDSQGDYHFVQISAGLIDFAFQAAKATALSWKRQVSPDGTRVDFSGKLDDVEQVLDADSAPLTTLRRTIESYLFEGVSRERDPTPLPPTYHPPVALLTAFNERFIVGHEIAHVLHQVHDVVHPGKAGIGEEFAADILAFRWMLAGCGPLDGVAPTMAAQSAFFVIAALEVLRQARDIVRHGAPRDDVGGPHHPANAQRSAVLREGYLQLVGHGDGPLSIDGALFPTRTLELLWSRLQQSGRTVAWQGRALHRIWDGQ